MEIVPAKPAQLDEIFSIFLSCKSKLEEQDIYQWTDAYPTKAIIDSDIESGYLYALNDNGRCLGVINLSEVQEDAYAQVQWEHNEGRVLVIHRLAVHPHHQGNGYATSLMDFAEGFGKDNGYASVRLDAYSGNEKVLSFYSKCGYRKRGEVRFPGRELSFFCFEKKL